MQQFEYDVEYTKGAENVGADNLSRTDVEESGVSSGCVNVTCDTSSGYILSDVVADR